MMVLKVKEKEYKVKFGYNSFCDTDLMERTEDLLKLFQSTVADDDTDVLGLGKVKELFLCVRDLLFVGFKKFNPVETVQEIGDIIDDYHDEAPEGEKRGVMDIFTQLSEELMNAGFLGEDLNDQTETEQNQQDQQDQKVVEMPQK
nr:MAG TPA: tail assembly chaperone protein [Caudoviricetes sp.]